MKRSFTKLFFILGTVFLFTASASAQSVLGTSVNVDTNPRVPNPGDTVSIVVTSYSTDLTQADFSWQVNGVVKKTGKGVTTYQMTAPSVGVASIVDITIDTKDLGTVSKRVTIAPAAVDIIEQPDSYTPPFYKGKALASVEGNITLVAMPNMVTAGGRKLPSSEIVFTWSRNGKVLGDQSGLGRNTITVKGPYIAEQTVRMSVEAKSPENSITAQGYDLLSVRNPQIIFYENNPLLGLGLYKAIPSSYTLTNSELSLYAVPYFFNSNVMYDFSNVFTWTINGLEVPSTEVSRNMLTVRSPTTSGTSVLSLTVQNKGTIFQTTQSSININFNGTSAGSVRF